MKTFNYYDSPEPHIIIDNFLSPKLAQACLEECSRLETFYVPAKTRGVAHAQDGCDACLKEIEYDKQKIRQNDVVYLDTLYENKREKSVILKALHDEVLHPMFLKSITNKGFFHILNSTNYSETILSRYGMCDFYGYHTDRSLGTNSRLVTLCYYLNNEPEQFEGGELILAGNNLSDTLKIQPKHNRAVIFQSDTTWHAVETVKLLGNKFEDGRFSINFWLSINEGSYKYQ